MHSSSDDTADSVVQRMTDYAASEIPGARYAGVTLVTSTAQVQTPATTHRYPAVLDGIQQRHQQGPCLSAAWRQQTMLIDDLATDDRWPLFRRDALAETPIKSILSFRLFASAETMGALNLYSEQPNAFDDEAEEIGYVIATHAALAWDARPPKGQFRSVLASRDIIGQAKGMLMARFDISAIAAFELLKRLSQHSNAQLVDMARRVTAMRNLKHF